MAKVLEFEKPIVELENKIEELTRITNDPNLNIADEVSKLQAKATKMLEQTYSKLTPWQKVQIARHSHRPKFFDYLEGIFDDFLPLAGDRSFGDDKAIVGGFGKIQGIPVMVIGQQKGKDTEERIHHNFGMPKPEGYRKATRLMEMADHFKLPIVTFVDTPGAYPGMEAEERGQAEAIATCLETCFKVSVPIITLIIGEGGSGGAIALAGCNKLLMLEHSVYSVISPEGCASILWRNAVKAPEASEAQKLSAQDLLSLGVADDIIPEPVGGAHRHPQEVMVATERKILQSLKEFSKMDAKTCQKHRREKFLQMGKKGL